MGLGESGSDPISFFSLARLVISFGSTDLVAGERVESWRHSIPTRVARKLKSPNMRSMLPSMQSNAGLDAGECLVKSTDPNRIESTRVGELPNDADGAEEASVPAPQIPTDGANEEGVTSTIPMVRDPGFREGRRRWWTTRLDRTRGQDLPRFKALCGR